MNKKFLGFFIFFGCLILTFLYLYYCRPLVDDELFNYGFAKNIIDGLVPYKDFNMIILPFSSYVLAIFLKIFGLKLYVYHFVIAGIVSIISYLSYKRVGYYFIIIYLLLLVYPYTGYNMFCLLLLMLLLFNKDKKNDYLDVFLISMMFLTKQTLVILIIPSVIFAAKKKKVIAIYLVIFMLFFLYLIINNSFNQFMDYCFFGMFDFTSKNNLGFKGFLFLEMIIIVFLIIIIIKSKRKDLIYLLLFQIIVFPIVDYFHFVIGFIPVVYCLINRFKKNILFTLYSFVSIITFFILLNYGIIFKGNSTSFMYHYDVDNFMKGRYTMRITKGYIEMIRDNIDKYSEYRPYILSDYSYLIKLNLDIPINKYDIINNGNMGYNGYKKYIKEIDDYCRNNKCIFFINEEEMRTKKVIQTNREILRYVDKNYKKLYISSVFSSYSN